MAKSSNRDGRIKTWKILRNNVRIGDSVRSYGDFLPEAPELPTFSTLMRADIIEEVWVDQEEFDAWEESLKSSSEEVANDTEEGIEGNEEEGSLPTNQIDRRKKTVVKKKGKKKDKKVEEVTIDEGGTNVIEQQSV